MTESPKDGDDTPKSALNVATEGESWTGPEDRELEPGSPSLESIAFVMLGVAATLAVFLQFVL